jgi:hypothetical protein
MNGMQKFLTLYVFLYFFQSGAADSSIEARLQGYVTLVSEGVGVRRGENSPLETTIALIKLALGRMEGAVFLPDEELILYLLAKNNLNPRLKDPSTEATLLHFAAFYSAYDVMHYLLYKMQVCSEVDREGKTPLHWACNPFDKIPRKEVLELLVQKRRDLINIRDFSGKTALFYLPLYSEAADFLLRWGANINTEDAYGRTVLFERKNEEATRYLCTHGVRVNHRDNNQLTALGGYLTEYSSLADRAKAESVNVEAALRPSNLSFRREVHEIRKVIRVLLEHGCYVSPVYHPAYKIKPHVPCKIKDNELKKERIKRLKVLEKTFGDILKNIEECLKWVKVRSKLSHEKASLPSVDPVIFFDRYSCLLPFFEARLKEMNEILKQEGGGKPLSAGEPFTQDVKFGYFLSRLSFSEDISPDSKRISPELYSMAGDLMRNKEEYAKARFLSDTERGEIGKKILEKIFP